MARKYLRESEPDSQGWVTVVAEQTEKGITNEVEYQTFGTKAGAPLAFGSWVIALVEKAKAGDAQAVTDLTGAYDSWVYGEDLNARQGNKKVVDFRIAHPGRPGYKINLTTGEVTDKADNVDPAESYPIESLVLAINKVSQDTAPWGAKVPKVYSAAADFLVASGKVTRAEGSAALVVKPATEAPATPAAPEAEAPKANARRR